MRTHIMEMMCLMILFTVLPGLAADNTAPAPYLGQEPPGLTPKVFAPGEISPKYNLSGLCFSKDGRECYFTVFSVGDQSSKIMVTRCESGQWTTPEQAPFSDSYSMFPSLADNDKSLYFIKLGKHNSVWKVRRATEGWSKPGIVGAPVSSPEAGAISCNVSTLGNLWICSHRPGGVGNCDLWRIGSVDGRFTEATNLGSLNSTANDCRPVPGPNEDYVIWHSSRPGGFGGLDLYISFPDGHGGWTTPRNLGPTINSSEHEATPYLSPDHKYLFFHRNDKSGNSKIYWVSVEAFLSDSNKPVSNKHD